MPVYIYNSHLGGEPFYTDYELSWDDMYCPTCGDVDYPLGIANTAQEGYDLVYDFYDDEELAQQMYNWLKPLEEKEYNYDEE